MTKNHFHERPARTVDVTELEPRLCFSQTPAGLVVPEPVWDGAPALVCLPDTCDAPQIVELDQPHDWQLRAQGQLPQELVMIDAAVQDREQIIAEFAARASATPVSIFILDGTRDGVEQLTDVLAHFDRVSAVHLFAHGAAGQIQLGSVQLSTQTLSQYAAQLTSWQDALTWDADLLIYGCDVAATEDGEELLEAIHVLTSADVAASVDLTGHASLGGDWDLEFVAGAHIEAHASLGPLFAQLWNHDLSIPATGEQRVNQDYPNHATNRQQHTMRSDRASDSAVAVANNGKHVVVWTSDGGGSDQEDVFFQLYDADGSKIGSQVLVNDEFIDKKQESASVAMDANGNFVVVWTSEDQDGSKYSVYYRRYNSNGDALDAAVRATTNSFSSGEQRDPDIAMNDAGQFAIVWEGEGVGDDEGIFARIFDPSGNPYDDPFLVNSDTSGDQSNPSVGIDGVGNIVVAWNQTDTHVAAGYFAQDGTPGPSIDTSQPIYAFLGESRNASVSVREDGLIAIAYEVKTPLSSRWRIHIQLHAAGLTDLNLNPFPLRSQSTSGDQSNPSVWFSDADDTVVATWDGVGDVAGQADDDGVFARRFRITPNGINNPTGIPLGDEFRVNVTTSGTQSAASVAGLDGNNFVVAWSGQGTGDNNGVFIRSFNAAAFSAGDDAAVVLEDSTGILIDTRSNDSTSGVVVTTLDTTATIGTVTNHGDGTFTYNPDGQFESLAEGATATDTFSYTITNGIDTSTATVTVSVSGQNDAPTSTSYLSTTDEEAAPYTDSLLSLALDVDNGAVLLVSNPALVSGNAIGVTISSAAGTISIDPSRYQYLHSGDQEVIVYSYDVMDEHGAAATATATVTINGQDDDPQAVDDTWGAVPTDTAVMMDKSTLLANDSDAEGDTLILLDYTQPANGMLLDVGASLEYLPAAGYFGADSFDYLLADAANRPQHYWRLDGNAQDAIGTNHGTLFGTTTAAGSFGNGLAFDKSDATDDYVRIPDVTYGANFSISFDFYIDDNDGTSFRYLYSHGPAGAPNSVNVFLREAQNGSTTAPNTLATVVADGNDITDLNGMDIDASSLIGGWHTYTLTVESGVGTKVYIDGVLEAANTDGADGVNPTTDVYLGAREDLSSTRFFDGRLDSVRIYDRQLELEQIARLHTIPASQVATVGLTVDARPTAVDDAATADAGQTITIAAWQNDFDPDSGIDLSSFTLSALQAGATVTNNGDGTFDFLANTAGSYTFDYEFRDLLGQLSNTATVTVTVSPPVLPVTHLVSGTIYEDVDGDGQIVDDGVGSAGVAVALYRDNGDGVADNADVLVQLTTTDASGQYVFDNLTSAVYFVVVDSQTLLPAAGLNGGYTASDIWADQTYGAQGSLYCDLSSSQQFTSAAGTHFGGSHFDEVDDAATLASSEHVIRVSVVSSDVNQRDFGFSFNVVTNVMGGDSQDADGINNGRTVQGSLRQFIANANAIAGGNVMRFVPAEMTEPTPGSYLIQRGQGPTQTGIAGARWWQLEVSTALPTLTDDFTVLDGTAYNGADGVSVLNTNASQLGYTGTVGVYDADGVANSGDEWSLGGLSGPELELVDLAGISRGLHLDANDITIRHLSIHGFGNSANFFNPLGNIVVGHAGTSHVQRVQILDNVLGSAPDAFAAPTSTNGANLVIFDADDGLVQGNLIGFANSWGIVFMPSASGGSADWTIQSNEIRGNGRLRPENDGIDLLDGSAAAVVRGNLLTQNSGSGIDMYQNVSSHVIEYNTVSDNGLGGQETSGIRIFGSGSQVRLNQIVDNRGAGVLVLGAADPGGSGQLNGTPATGNVISQNQFGGNGGLAIDLLPPVNSWTAINSGNGVSVNDGVVSANTGNIGLDAPDILSATIGGGSLSVSGQATAGARVEIYLAAAGAGDEHNGDSYGEGVLFLGQATADSSGNFGFATFSLPPALDASSLVTAIAIDGSGNTSEFNKNKAVNAVPMANADAFSLLEDAPLTATVAANDLDGDGDTLLYSLLSGPAQGTLSLEADGTFTFIPNADFHGTVSFVYRVSDGQGGTDDATVTMTVTPVNDIPTAGGDGYTLFEDGTLSVTTANGLLLNDTDIDDDALVVLTTPVVNASHGALVLNLDGTFTYTPNADFHGTDSFVYRVSDGQGGTDDATVTITVTPVNDVPTAVDDVYSITENGTLSVTTANGLVLNDTDVDGDTLLVLPTPVTGPSHGTLILNADGTFDYTPDADYHGTDAFVYRVDDGRGGTAEATVGITIHATNSLPTAADDAYATPEDNTLTVTVANGVLLNDGDVDGDALTVDTTPVIAPGHGTLMLQSDGAFVYVPQSNFHGTDSFVYRVRDGNGGETTGIVQITIQPINDAPVAVDDEFTLMRGGSLTLGNISALDNDEDIDGDVLTGNLLSGPTHGQVIWRQDGTFDYVHDGSSTASDAFTYQVQDPGGKVGVATVKLNIQDLDAAPQAVEDSFTTFGQLLIKQKEAGLLANDLDDHPDSLAATMATAPSHGTVTLNADGTFLYTPNSVFVGKDEFQYAATDASGQTSVTKVRIEVMAPLPPLPPSTSTPDEKADSTSPVTKTTQESVDNPSADTDATANETGTTPSVANVGAAPLKQDSTEPFRREDATAATQSEVVAAVSPANNIASLDGNSDSANSGVFTITRAIDYLGRHQDSQLDRVAANVSVTPLTQATLESVRALLTGQSMQRSLNQLSQQLQLSFGVPQIAATGLMAATSTFTVGYVAWAFRAGYLMASVLTTIPTWQTIDPMPILSYIDDEDENSAERRESLEALISRS